MHAHLDRGCSSGVAAGLGQGLVKVQLVKGTLSVVGPASPPAWSTGPHRAVAVPAGPLADITNQSLVARAVRILCASFRQPTATSSQSVACLPCTCSTGPWGHLCASRAGLGGW